MRKSIKNLLALTVLAAVMGLVLGCTSGPKAGPAATQQTEVLDNKGAALNIPTPPWVMAYVEGGNYTVEAMSEYKNDHCFVVYYVDNSRDFAINWVANADGPAQVAQAISTTVAANAVDKSSGESGGEVSAAFRAAAESMSNASFTGMRKAADWWQIVRNKATKVQEAQAFALYTIDKKRLDEQIALHLANIVENNQAHSAAEREIYRELIADIRANGFNNR
jgi:hypothetical protein